MRRRKATSTNAVDYYRAHQVPQNLAKRIHALGQGPTAKSPQRANKEAKR